MNKKIPRIRMFAGPNGSGKSTIKSVISPHLLGIYINPDEIEQSIQQQGFFDFRTYQVQTIESVLFDFFSQSTLLKSTHLLDQRQALRFSDGKLLFTNTQVNSYFAAVIADFIRTELIKNEKSFTFETVMSAPDKVELLRNAQKKGYRTYLYYIATDDPEINISRCENRVKMGGHAVPKDKIISRYYRSLDLLLDAVKSTHRAYVFDNSSYEHVWLAEISNGNTLEMKTSLMPTWFKKALWDKFTSTSYL